MARQVRVGRISKEMMDLIRKVQAMAIMGGKTPPTISEATKIIADMAKTKEGQERLESLTQSFIPFRSLGRMNLNKKKRRRKR